ncbi:GAF domain-containing protein [Lactococcus cremoris]|uniref:Pleiotropic transcriptional repressor n=1 Tax=Lactococcus cremoris subsp. tructae TaxID=542833 RepID=A0A2A5SYI4_LACLC|nr:transcriptional regulator [Lactococcus cremoris]PCS20967.1 pleiotropic transcriptional repressor [Lactococcus cremoris subsp. tructae]
MKEIYDKIKEINVTLKRSFIDLEKSLPYQDVAEKSAKILECTLFMIDTKRNFLGYGFSEKFYQSDMNLQNFFTYQKNSKELSTEILNQYEMSESEQMTHSILKSVKELSGKFANQYLTLIPIEGNHLRLGTVFLLTDAPLNQEEAILADFLSTFIGNQMSYIMLSELETKRRNETFVSLVQSLSRSELEAFKSIIEKIE